VSMALSMDYNPQPGSQGARRNPTPLNHGQP
jgi:hypothetical protein